MVRKVPATVAVPQHGTHPRWPMPRRVVGPLSALAQVVGRYNWTLAQEVGRALGRHSVYMYPFRPSRVLALSPRLDLSRTRSWAEFASIIAGLAQVRQPACQLRLTWWRRGGRRGGRRGTAKGTAAGRVAAGGVAQQPRAGPAGPALRDGVAARPPGPRRRQAQPDAVHRTHLLAEPLLVSAGTVGDQGGACVPVALRPAHRALPALLALPRVGAASPTR